MNETRLVNEQLEKTAQVLIRCFWMGFAVLWFWFFALLLADDLAFKVQASIIPITLEQFHLTSYVGMMIVKTITFVFFLFPYIAIRMVLKKNTSA